MPHPALNSNSVTVVTGGAAGIGLAAATQFAKLGMKVVIVDLGQDRLDAAAEILRQAGAADIMAIETDVSDIDAMRALDVHVTEKFGGTDILMNNAGIQPGSTMFGPIENWQRIIAVNLWGPINGAHAFAPGMIARGRPGMIINTGSKQGITTPPGDPAYNVTKSGLKTFTEALEHELRDTEGSQITAHLLIPGFVYTELTKGDRTEKPAGAWTPKQTADFMFESLDKGDFYILCPDNDVARELDEKRMAWAMGDIIENRPPLSRWHADYGDAFAKYLKD
ncbi:MAG: SDR family NAD(P)-dependent oxidoreductase [Paracoccaceae bacterium]